MIWIVKEVKNVPKNVPIKDYYNPIKHHYDLILDNYLYSCKDEFGNHNTNDCIRDNCHESYYRFIFEEKYYIFERKEQKPTDDSEFFIIEENIPTYCYFSYYKNSFTNLNFEKDIKIVDEKVQGFYYFVVDSNDPFVLKVDSCDYSDKILNILGKIKIIKS